MTYYESDWVFNVGLKVAVAIFLATLAIGLVTEIAPLTALFRSGAAFAVFVTISWAAAHVWEPAQPEEDSDETAEDAEKSAAKPGGQSTKPEALDRLDAKQPAQQAA